MKKEESIISSTNVSIDKNEMENEKSEKFHKKPWIILICSDLGFISEKPEKITASILNDFISNVKPKIFGKIEDGLPYGIEPFSIQYDISDIKDLSPSSFSDKIPCIRQLKNVLEILSDFTKKRINLNEGFQKISSLSLPESIEKKLKNIFISKESYIGYEYKKTNNSSSSKIDYILSMVDINENNQKKTNKWINFGFYF